MLQVAGGSGGATARSAASRGKPTGVARCFPGFAAGGGCRPPGDTAEGLDAGGAGPGVALASPGPGAEPRALPRRGPKDRRLGSFSGLMRSRGVSGPHVGARGRATGDERRDRRFRHAFQSPPHGPPGPATETAQRFSASSHARDAARALKKNSLRDETGASGSAIAPVKERGRCWGEVGGVAQLVICRPRPERRRDLSRILPMRPGLVSAVRGSGRTVRPR